VIVDRQGSDADVGRCGIADSPAQMGSESEYLQWRTVSGAPRDIRFAMRGSRTSQTVGTAGHNRVICSLPGAGRTWRGPPSVGAKLDDVDEYEQHGGDRVTAQGDDPGIERG
jgi:hypothetical protein